MTSRSKGVDSIVDRLERLEYLASGADDRDDLMAQVDELDALVQKLFSHEESLKRATSTISHMGLWTDVEDSIKKQSAEELSGIDGTENKEGSLEKSSRSNKDLKERTEEPSKSSEQGSEQQDQDSQSSQGQDKDKDEQNKQNEYEWKKNAVVSKHDKLGELASSLQALQDAEVPPAKNFGQLADLKDTQVPAAQQKVDHAHEQGAELSIRSAQASKVFLEQAVVEQNRVWTDFEQRMEQCESALRRIEAARKREKYASS
uniref:ARAD1C18678p n=1 Tax=Blastobotrys adeninivorans TaxID=409370 RepID=A0A060T768_BLAAD